MCCLVLLFTVRTDSKKCAFCMSASLDQIEMLEAGLIHMHIDIPGCYNVALGGDGCVRARNKSPPFYCYVAGARADIM
jgi:hypothetical protein